MLINSWLTLVKNSLQKSNSRSSAKGSRKHSRSVVSTQAAAEMMETRALLTANLLVDGGFELGQQTPGTATVANPGHSWGAWTSSDSTTALLGMPYAGMATYEGVEAMHLGNGYGPGAVNQFFATTIGVEYEVSLAIKGWLNGSGHVRATLTNGANTDLIANFHNPGGAWVSNTFSFIATGTSTNIKLQNVSGASTIDDVSVVPNVAAVMSIGDASVTEGNSGTKVLSFPVTLSNPVDEAVSVDYATQNVDSQVVVTVAPTSGPTTLQGATGLTSTGIILEPGMTVTVTATGTATWGGPTLVMTPNGWAGGGYPLAGSGFFLPNVPAFGLVAQIGDAAPVFVGSGPIVLSGAGELRFAVNDDAYGDNRGTGFVVTSTVSPAPNAATAGSDYVGKTGTLTIPAGSTTGTINITVNGDTVIEPDETLRVLLSNLQANGRDVQLQGPQFFATGTIINDDFNTAPVAVIDSVSTDEASALTYNVLGNDSDAENNIVASLTAAISAPTAGVLTDNGSGSFTFNPSGAFESLAAGDSAHVSFGYRIEDAYGATSTATVIITINGVNDAATISGNNAGTLTEDGTGDNGSLSVSDVDNGESVFQPQTGVTGIYGTFSIDAAGNWSYTRTSNLDAMNAGDVLADGFTVVSADGAASQLVTITITGVNDIASITGDNAGSMTEDGSGDSGVLTVSDLDDAENVFQPPTSVTGTYGTFSLNAAGNWSYIRTANLQSLAVGESVADSFIVVSLDGTASETVTITITGENDAPVMTGVASNHVDVCDASANKVVTISGSFSDIDTSDTHTATVNWGDGTNSTVAMNQLANTLAGSHNYQNGGIYTVTVTINDGNGGTATSTTTAVVQGAGVVNGTLYIIGTPGRDHVNLKFDEKKNELKVDVKLNQTGGSDGGFDGGSDGGSDGGHDGGKQTFAISSINRVVAYLCDGDDQYNGGSDGGSDGGSAAAISQFVFGEAGNDNIQGGRGKDVLSGGSGKDDIKGGRGADILIGGTGNDNLQGGRGNDLIIGGSTANENNLTALDQALAEWSIDHLTAALSFIGTVTDDNEKDDLFGEGGNDYLHYGNGDKRKN